MVKPFRSKDVLITLDVAFYLHQNRVSEKRENLTTKEFSRVELPSEFQNLIGKSPNFIEILEQAKRVGPSDTSVLILGESGTGKELIAHSIHNVSPRRARPFIVVNCGTLPSNLIESELLDMRKAHSPTHLSSERVNLSSLMEGQFSLMKSVNYPLELQVKFLRVLQEKEIESVGGRPKKINVRVLAATNKDLEEEVAAGRFRIDLYYRLNVFPLLMPPLRDRKIDIPLLAEHFLNKYGIAEGRPTSVLSEEAMKKLQHYHWPGNIRELENTIQRNIVLAKGLVIESLEVSASKKIVFSASGERKFKTMIEMEREHILSVLESCNWKISGKGGAAEILDVNVNTLNSRIKKLGIEKIISARKT
jgi:two-component system, NtrC family, response regulator HydG